jgi:hypothetical protein
MGLHCLRDHFRGSRGQGTGKIRTLVAHKRGKCKPAVSTAGNYLEWFTGVRFPAQVQGNYPNRAMRRRFNHLQIKKMEFQYLLDQVKELDLSTPIVWILVTWACATIAGAVFLNLKNRRQYGK